ncbi:MAG TPA: hypothetical protein VF950_28495 [Planctomycetota bacterium]
MSKPGFRFSVVDGIFLLLCAGAIVLLRERMGTFVWIIAAAAGHFFLFCNVFRVRRSYELAWTAVFLANVAAWTFSGRFSWTGILAVQLPVTLAAIALEIRSPRYHGIFSRPPE